MTELENQNLQEQAQPEQDAPEQAQPEAAAETAGTIQTEPTPFTGPDAASDPMPTLTLEPEPVADPFADLPEPPKAPEPPKEVPPQQPVPPQYTQPQYTQPQYTAPQQNTAPQYQQPYYQGQPQQPYQQPAKVYYNVPPAGYPQKSRLAAGLLAIILGCFGVHNFYLGFRTRATIQLVVSIVGMLLSIVVIGVFALLGIEIWAFIEGVQILTANNPERLYDANGVILRD